MTDLALVICHSLTAFDATLKLIQIAEISAAEARVAQMFSNSYSFVNCLLHFLVNH